MEGINEFDLTKNQIEETQNNEQNQFEKTNQLSEDLIDEVEYCNPELNSNLIIENDHKLQINQECEFEPKNQQILTAQISETEVSTSNQSDVTPNEQFLDILLENELYNDEEDKSDLVEKQIYYLPLAIGNSNIPSDKLNQEFENYISSNPPSESTNLLKDLGRSLSKDSHKSYLEPSNLSLVGTNLDQSNLSSISWNECTNSILTRIDFTNPSFQNIPDSIAHQFNQIAKMNKNSLRSRRTVKTTKTKLYPNIDYKRQASFEDSKCNSTILRSNLESTTGGGSQASTSSSGSHSNKFIDKHYLTKDETFHARFYSDETTNLPESTFKTNIIQQIQTNSIYDSNQSRLANVFRSKSALSSTCSALNRAKQRPKHLSYHTSGYPSETLSSEGAESSPYLHSSNQSQGLHNETFSSSKEGNFV